MQINVAEFMSDGEALSKGRVALVYQYRDVLASLRYHAGEALVRKFGVVNLNSLPVGQRDGVDRKGTDTVGAQDFESARLDFRAP